jgi:hypothetical protein
LIRKFGFEKKDIKIDLANRPEIKETIDSKNGYLLIVFSLSHSIVLYFF